MIDMKCNLTDRQIKKVALEVEANLNEGLCFYSTDFSFNFSTEVNRIFYNDFKIIRKSWDRFLRFCYYQHFGRKVDEQIKGC